MKKLLVTVALTGFAFAQPAAHAATGSAIFNGTVLNTCIVTVGAPGIIAPNSDYTVMSSDNAGGSRASVSVLATGATFNVSAIAPSTYTLGDSSSVTFASDYSLSGATSKGVTAGATATALNAGATSVSVGLTGTKSSGNYTAGNYTGAVTVRCE